MWLEYSCLENPKDRGAWLAAVHGVAKSRTRLSDFTFTFHFRPLKKEMATHSYILAWRIPWTEEPGWLQSMGSQRVRHDWSSSPHTHVKKQDKQRRFMVYSTGNYIYYLIVTHNGIQSAKVLNTIHLKLTQCHKSTTIFKTFKIKTLE